MTTATLGAKAHVLDLSVPVLVKQQLEEMEQPIPPTVFDQLDAELKAHAEKLATLKRLADDAEAAYKAARDAMEDEFAKKYADIITEKQRAERALVEVDANARVLLEARASVIGASGKIIGGLFTIETHAAPEVTNQPEFIRWVVANAPVLAPTLLSVNAIAVKSFVTRFSESDTDDETGAPIRRMFAPFDKMPIYTGTRYATRIEWSAIKRAYPPKPELKQGADGDQRVITVVPGFTYTADEVKAISDAAQAVAALGTTSDTTIKPSSDN